MSRCFAAQDARMQGNLGANSSLQSVPQAVYSGAGLHLPWACGPYSNSQKALNDALN